MYIHTPIPQLCMHVCMYVCTYVCLYVLYVLYVLYALYVLYTHTVYTYMLPLIVPLRPSSLGLLRSFEPCRPQALLVAKWPSRSRPGYHIQTARNLRPKANALKASCGVWLQGLGSTRRGPNRPPLLEQGSGEVSREEFFHRRMLGHCSVRDFLWKLEVSFI